MITRGNLSSCSDLKILLVLSMNKLCELEMFQSSHNSYTPKISAFELFSQIGGTLSCLISLSVFTIFEILEILILIFNACLFSKSQT
jgi:hypothetical protein